EKLAYFSFAEKRLHVDHVRLEPGVFLCDHAFECVGGMGCGPAINQMIDCVAPEGTLALLGVSENNVAINTRLVLEKGLRLFGSSRSGVADFQRAADLLEANPKLGQYLETLVGAVVPVRNIANLHEAFRQDMQMSFGKTILKFEA
ncbi:MAG: zinc-binding dehydrogenase, partial [Oscillospiraceae bacterium]|nr:zinc-binding dehydrogenase [Oscillospiraceae bacterium]